MKLVELLEALKANVHTNVDRTLSVIDSFVKKEFGLVTDRVEGQCLAVQMIYSMSAVSGISPDILIRALNASDVVGFRDGVTLKDLWQVFNKNPISLGRGQNKTVTFDMSLETFDNIDDVITQVTTGQPVVTIVASSKEGIGGAADMMSNYVYWSNRLEPRIAKAVTRRDTSTRDGIISQQRMNKQPQLPTPGSRRGRYFHALMAIGVDRGENQLILRETRHVYGYKGYIKIPIDLIRQHSTSFKFLSIVVNDVKVDDAIPLKQSNLLPELD